ncbi:hypothetical protein NA56DRAFT_311026 [Hyaloscypha hepaticicola]|uniref:Uncharacterized protein n=1 Tax=Hyaloscypha hepaticicola TaxID=2082293 RepID=A0A2J6PR20_9HELO|nr:hypothetical protein NA56DRAFT_311026 [Hyaloscypha hepaticicola]
MVIWGYGYDILNLDGSVLGIGLEVLLHSIYLSLFNPLRNKYCLLHNWSHNYLYSIAFSLLSVAWFLLLLVCPLRI